jgi:hypothetical protein
MHLSRGLRNLFRREFFCRDYSLGNNQKTKTKTHPLNPRSSSCRIMSLTNYQAAPPRVFGEICNVLLIGPDMRVAELADADVRRVSVGRFWSSRSFAGR